MIYIMKYRRKYLELQKEGLNGKLGTISAWLAKNNNQWMSDTGRYRSEGLSQQSDMVSETSASVVHIYKISVSLTGPRVHFNYFSVKC